MSEIANYRHGSHRQDEKLFHAFPNAMRRLFARQLGF
jgi:hypothetical protein